MENMCAGRPKSRGEIRLASRSPWDKPIIDPKYFSHPDDIVSMVEGNYFPELVYHYHYSS